MRIRAIRFVARHRRGDLPYRSSRWGDEHVVAYGDGSLVEHNAIVVGKEIFAQVNVMPIVAKERRYDDEFFGCSTDDFPNEFFSFF